MGEISDAMEDGTLCIECGEYIGTDNGFRTTCPACEEAMKEDADLRKQEDRRGKS